MALASASVCSRNRWNCLTSHSRAFGLLSRAFRFGSLTLVLFPLLQLVLMPQIYFLAANTAPRRDRNANHTKFVNLHGLREVRFGRSSLGPQAIKAVSRVDRIKKVIKAI